MDEVLYGAGAGIQGRLHGKHVRSVRTCLSTGSLVQDADVVSEEDENVPKRVCIFVEPSPFTYVCGYKNRFCETIKHLVGAGCEVLVITTGRCIPEEKQLCRYFKWPEYVGKGFVTPA